MKSSTLSSDTQKTFDFTKPEEWGPSKYGIDVRINSECAELSNVTLPWVVDVEDDEHDGFVGIGLYSGGAIYYYTQISDDLNRLLERAQIVAHNGKSDLHKLKKWGVKVRPEQLVFDTMLASYVMDSTKESHGLKELAAKELGIFYPSYKEIVGKGHKKATLDKHNPMVVAAYNGMDCLSTYKLWQLYTRTLTAEQQKYLNEIELPTAHLLYEMEEKGIKVNVPYLNNLDKRFGAEAEKLRCTILRLCGEDFNPASPKQVQERFFKRLGIQEASTGKQVLSKYGHIPYIQILSRFREYEKLRGTYTSPLQLVADSSSRVHCTFNQCSLDAATDTWKGIRTGRLSCKEPNLQNQPARSDLGSLIRKAFVAEPGQLIVDLDYSQIEWLLAASFSNDSKMQEILLKGQKIYTVISEATGVSYIQAKTAALAMNYNAGGYKIAEILKIQTSAAFEFVDKYKAAFPQYFAWKNLISSTPEPVQTILGRRIRPESAALRVPYLVQGSAADIIKVALIRIRGELGLVPSLTVHDEVLLEVPEVGAMAVAEKAKTLMESIVTLCVPLKVSVGIGKSWSEAK